MSKSLELFKEITQIPRPSKKEGKIREYLISWAESKGFEYKTDKIGNLVVYVLGKNCKSLECVILQSHMDMVCVKTPDSKLDFETDSLDIYEEDGFIKARDTSLGADNGIGIALAMSAVDFESHPPMELVFTVDEEQGMSGILNLDFNLLSGKKVINIDSENEDEICISSAGGARINVTKNLARIAGKFTQYNLIISGMKGGHSGIEIHKNHGNAIKLLIDFLYEYSFPYEIANIIGGIADNVIPSEVQMIFGTKNIEVFEDSLKKYILELKEKLDCPDITFKITKIDTILPVIEDSDFIISRIHDIKVGVIAMSKKIANLVETSINLGIINLEGNIFELTYLPRSSNMEEFDKLLIKLENHFPITDDYIFTINSKYPGWQDNPEGELIKIATEEFLKTTGKNPEIIAIHAGLECGALVAGLGEGTSAISIGPNMHDIHSTNERLEIASVEKIEKILEGILGKLS
ncbi:MAG: beta-Ala-His dipeptidase [Candidatus Gracilibacteria bacterium]|nr:beta-Ala-His dipeptidase [Candidatus Gracilibacteria bacterium]